MQSCNLVCKPLTAIVFGVLLLASCGKEIEVKEENSSLSDLELYIIKIKEFSDSSQGVESRNKDNLFQDLGKDEMVGFIEDIINYDYGTNSMSLNKIYEVEHEINLENIADRVNYVETQNIYRKVLKEVSKKFYELQGDDKIFSFIDLELINMNLNVKIFYGIDQNVLTNLVTTRSTTPNDYFLVNQSLELHKGEDNLITGDQCSYDCNNPGTCSYTSTQIGSKGFNNYWFNNYLPAGGTWINITTKAHSSDNVSGWWLAPRYSTVPCEGYIALNNYVDVTTQLLYNEDAILGKKCFYFRMDDGIFTFPWNNHRYVWMSLGRWGNYVINPDKEELPG